MVLVHLYYENVQFGAIGPWLGEYTRFAAGGFVFVSGLAIGAIFLPKTFEPQRRWETYLRLWQRSLRVLGWQYLVAMAWVPLDVYLGSHAPVDSVPQLLWNIFRLREGGDLLPLYVVLIGVSPLLLACCRSRRGKTLLALASIGIFIFGRLHPYAVAIDPQGKFPPLLWQLVFIAGILGGSVLKQYDQLARRTKLAIAASLWIAFGLLFWCEYWLILGFPRCPVSLVFTKTPLTTGELLRYLTLVGSLLITTDLAWRWIWHSAAVSFAATLGRSTLQVYVAHTFLIEFSRFLAEKYASWGAWQILFIPMCLAVLWVLAIALQWRSRRPLLAIDWSFLFGAEPARRVGD
jgi:hypothetical protein